MRGVQKGRGARGRSESSFYFKGGSRAVVRGGGAIFFGALFGCLPSGVNPR